MKSLIVDAAIVTAQLECSAALLHGTIERFRILQQSGASFRDENQYTQFLEQVAAALTLCSDTNNAVVRALLGVAV